MYLLKMKARGPHCGVESPDAVFVPSLSYRKARASAPATWQCQWEDSRRWLKCLGTATHKEEAVGAWPCEGEKWKMEDLFPVSQPPSLTFKFEKKPKIFFDKIKPRIQNIKFLYSVILYD